MASAVPHPASQPTAGSVPSSSSSSGPDGKPVYRWCLFVLRQDQSAETLKIYTGPGLLHVILDDVPRSRWPPFIRPPKGGIPTLVLLPLHGDPAPTQLPMKTGGACKAYLHHLQQLHLAEINRPLRPKTPPTVLAPFPDTPRTVAQRQHTTATPGQGASQMSQGLQGPLQGPQDLPGGHAVPSHVSGPSRAAQTPGRLPATPATPARFLQTPVEVPLQYQEEDQQEPEEPEQDAEPDDPKHPDKHITEGLVDMTQRLIEMQESLLLRGSGTPHAHGYGIPASDLQVAAMDIGDALEQVAKQVKASAEVQEIAQITSEVVYALPTVEPMAPPPISSVVAITVQVPADDHIADLQVLPPLTEPQPPPKTISVEIPDDNEVPHLQVLHVEEKSSPPLTVKRKSSRKAPAAAKTAVTAATKARTRRGHANEQPLMLNADSSVPRCGTDAQGNVQ